jgi:hypothetical protein
MKTPEMEYDKVKSNIDNCYEPIRDLDRMFIF